MKNSSFPARMLSLLLAVAVLFGLASPAGAVASSNTVRYQQVDNSSVSANLLHSADQETDETPQYSDTDIVRVSIFRTGAGAPRGKAGALPPSVKRPVCAPGPGEFVPACEEGPDSPKGWGSRNLLSPVRPKGRTLRLRGQTGTPMPRG